MNEEVDPEKTPLISHTDDNGDDDGDDVNPYPPPEEPQPGPPGEQIDMSTMNRPPPERGSHTAGKSFIEGTPSERVWSSDTLKIKTANEILQQDYPYYGKDGKFLTLKVKEGLFMLLVQERVRPVSL